MTDASKANSIGKKGGITLKSVLEEKKKVVAAKNSANATGRVGGISTSGGGSGGRGGKRKQ